MTTDPISTPDTVPTMSDLAAVPPAPAPAGLAGTGPKGKTRHPWGVWGLSIITLGIYYLYWYFKVNSELRDYDASIQVEPGIATLAAIIPIANLVTIYNCGGRIEQAQVKTGVPERCSGVIGLVLGILGGFSVVYYQSQLNKIWAAA